MQTIRSIDEVKFTDCSNGLEVRKRVGAKQDIYCKIEKRHALNGREVGYGCKNEKGHVQSRSELGYECKN